MPRRARLRVSGIPLHVIQRGNNRQVCFVADEDYGFYLDCLGTYARKASCQIHSYVLMTNHVHLLLSSPRPDGAGVLMKALGQRYVQYFNRQYRRSGSLWEGRFRSCLVQQEGYFLGCQRYLELNPVRAGMVEHPAEYRWSSYRVNGQGESNPLITPHEEYLRLGTSASEREHFYRQLFRHELEPGLVHEIRVATNGNYALGNERSAEQIARAVGRRATRGKAGRPCKGEPESGELPFY